MSFSTLYPCCCIRAAGRRAEWPGGDNSSADQAGSPDSDHGPHPARIPAQYSARYSPERNHKWLKIFKKDILRHLLITCSYALFIGSKGFRF